MAIFSIDTAPVHILFHLSAGATAVALGGVLLVSRKGTIVHRVLGRVWFVLMYCVAIGSFWIRSDGDLSWIHGLSVLMVVTLTYSLWSILSGKVNAHRSAMLGAYAGLCVTAAFTLLPYRLMGQLLFN